MSRSIMFRCMSSLGYKSGYFVLSMPSHSLTAPSVAPSRTKREFFAQFNLMKGYKADENIFRKMLVCHSQSQPALCN